MSLFLLVYDRKAHKLIDCREFSDRDWEAANRTRLDAQRVAIRNHLDHEIVLFQADSLEVLKHTHGSYFLTPDEMVDRAASLVDAS